MLARNLTSSGMNTNVFKRQVLNPQHYPVDLARDVWQDKMDLIDKMRKEALGEGEEE